ncbi:MAG: HAD family hydrolase [Solirubrobacterales bacterium]
MDSDQPKALIVDFGGVLTTSIWPAFEAFSRSEGLEHNAVRELFKCDSAALADLRELETGTCEPEEFERRFAGHLGIPDRAEGLIGRLFGGLAPDEQMIAAVRAARAAGIRTGLISNSWGRTIYDEELIGSLFDAVVISGDVGLHKPQPEIFLLACERLGVESADAVFVDDLRENCAGAEEVGMTAVLHRDTPHTMELLAALLEVDVSGEPADLTDRPRRPTPEPPRRTPASG